MRKSRNKGISLLAAFAALSMAAPAFAADKPVYVESLLSEVSLTAIATSGDVYGTGNYVFPGTPDGMGAVADGNNIRFLINSELSYSTDTNALQRANGAAQGSNVSSLTYNPTTGVVSQASDFLTSVTYFNYQAQSFGTTGTAPDGAAAKDSYGTPLHTTFIGRLCSASLSPAGRLSYKKGTKVYGITDSVFLNGEETGDEGRAFATNSKGAMVQIPKFGLAAWETFNVAPTNSMVTAVIGNEDGSATSSQVSMYVGTKTATGNWYDRAGFTNGKRYILKISGHSTEASFRASVGKGKTSPVEFNEVTTNFDGVTQNLNALNVGTALARVEDGAFDPKHPNDYYFVTTESNKDVGATAKDPALPNQTRDGGALWRLRFKDIRNPLLGASITMLLNGSEAPYMNKPDNIEIDSSGNILIQEDPGSQPIRERIFAYRISDGKIATLTQFKARYFEPGAAEFITQDEETSGIIEVTSLMKRPKTDTAKYYAFVAQVHAPTLTARPDLSGLDAAASKAVASAIEGGQVYIMKVTDWNAVFNH